jgi:triacylglycerol lipase
MRLWLLLTAAAVLALALVALALVRRWWLRRRLAPRPLQVPRLPLVLVHGLAGFDGIGPGRLRQEYFRRIARDLAARGARVHVPRLSPVAGVPVRAEQLANFIRALPARKVNVIAHSMGGLDCRYALCRLGLADRVAALVTIATPHHGSPLADLARLRPTTWLRKRLARLGLATDALDWLTVGRTLDFNRECPDVPGVFYASVVGTTAPGFFWRAPQLLPTWWYLRWRGIPANDGMVPAASQRWGEVIAEVALDHWAQIGWARGVGPRARELYETICRELERRGL